MGTLGPFIALVLACGFFATQSDRFLTLQNFSLILQQVMVVGTIAIGQTLIFLTAIAVEMLLHGIKSFVQPHPADASKEIRFVCLEGNESGTYFRGSGRVVGGLPAHQLGPVQAVAVVLEEDRRVHGAGRVAWAPPGPKRGELRRPRPCIRPAGRGALRGTG